MNDVDLSKLFQKFTQVGSNVEKKRLGTGLGLWITKNLCINMGGDIKCYSKIGKGSIFVAVIKCNKCESPIDILEDYLIEEESPKHALIADDNKMNQET